MKMQFYFFILVFLSSLIFSDSQAQTSQENILPVENYGSLPDISMVSISPNGKVLAYRTTENKQDRIIVFDYTKKVLLQSVNVKKIRPRKIYFISDDKLIIVGTKNIDMKFFGKIDFSAAFVYDIKTNNTRQLLVQGKFVSKWQSDLSSIIGRSSDGKYLYMPAYEAERDGIKNTRFNLMKVSMDDAKENPSRELRSPIDTVDFFMGENDQVIARERYNNTTNIHRIEARDGDGWRDIYREEVKVPHIGLSGLSTDEKSLVISSSNRDGRVAYYLMSLKDGERSDAIFERDDADVEQVFTDMNRRVMGVKYSGFQPSYEFIDSKLNKMLADLVKALPDNTLSIIDHTPDWNTIVFYLEGNGKSGDFILYDKGEFQQIAFARPDIPAKMVNNVYEYSYKARDGLDIPTLLTYPNFPTDPQRALPAIILPHGGPASYDKKGFNWLSQYFANRGFLVIQPQFRGSSGFGWGHRKKGRGEWAGKMQDDLTDAVNEFVKLGEIDPKRICIVGASYGGYAALVGAVFTPELYQCVISINGVSDIEEILRTEKSRRGDKHWVISYWNDIIAKNNLEDDFLEKISPINSVKRAKAPILLIHGEIDQVVNVKQSKNMYRRLKGEDKDVTFIELEGEGHSLSRNATRIEALEAIEKFIKDI